MTAQIHDEIKYDGRYLSVVGVNGEGLFDPEKHGLCPSHWTTSCWRGHVCTYEVAADQLRLKRLKVGLEGEQREAAGRSEGPKLFGKPPSFVTDNGFVYPDLDEEINFTGGLLIATGFIQKMYVHMGFQPAWKYREVHELIFENGRLVRATDRSCEIAEFRKDIEGKPLEPSPKDDEEKIREWIERRSSLHYSW